MKPLKWTAIIASSLLVVMIAGYWLLDHYKYQLYDLSTELGMQEAGLKSEQITIGPHTIHYLDTGPKPDKPVMVYVHGFGAFKENWIQMAMEMHQGYRLISVDLPGHGESSFDPAANYDIDRQVETLHKFAEKVIHTPSPTAFYMTGNSMGGAITALYAATYPDDIKASILLNPGHIYDHDSELAAYLEKGIHPLIIKTGKEFDFLVDFTMEAKPFLPWPITAVSAEKMANRYDKNQKIWKDITTDQQYDFKERIATTTVPTFILWGKQDRVINYRNSEVYKELIPHAEVKLLEGVGHAPMVEIPAQTASLIEGFLKEVAAGD